MKYWPLTAMLLALLTGCVASHEGAAREDAVFDGGMHIGEIEQTGWDAGVIEMSCRRIVMAGMTEEQVTATWGKPDRTYESGALWIYDEGGSNSADFGSVIYIPARAVRFNQGRVVAVGG